MAHHGPRFPWVGVSAIAAIVVVAAVAWLQIPEIGKGLPEQRAGLPALVLSRISESMSADLLAEQIAAYDPTPMFIPSAMNSSDPAVPAGVQPGVAGPFEALPPALFKTGPVRFLLPVPIPDSPVAGLRLTERSDAPLALARMDAGEVGLAARAATIEVIRVDGGGTALAVELALPVSVLEGNWQPLELMGAVSPAGQVGELIVTTSSGSDEVDDFFRSHIRDTVRVGARIKAGFYVFRAGP